MHPPLTPTPWDGKLEAIGRKLVPMVCRSSNVLPASVLVVSKIKLPGLLR